MSKIDKLISRLENNPNNASFDDLKRILEYFGWGRGRGNKGFVAGFCYTCGGCLEAR